MNTDLSTGAREMANIVNTALGNALKDALYRHLGRTPSNEEIIARCRKEIMPNGHTWVFFDDQPIFATTEAEWELSDDFTYTMRLKTCAIPPADKPSTPKPMNSEIQRLTNLRNFFIAKRETCEEEIRLQESQIKLWRESADEVDRSIAQAEKAVPEATLGSHCKNCNRPLGDAGCTCSIAAMTNTKPVAENCIPESFADKMWVLHHNPSVGYQVNIPGQSQKQIDLKPLGESKDLIGFGKTIEETFSDIVRKSTVESNPPVMARCKYCGCNYPYFQDCPCQKTKPA